jgi:hypothetical protein
MATYSILGQSNPAAATATTAYTVPSTTNTVVSSLIVCNRSTTPTTFRIYLDPAAGGASDEKYIYYGLPIDGNDTFIATIGVTLATTDLVRVYATLATLSFTVVGSEISTA